MESEGGKTLPLGSPGVESAEQAQIPEMPNAESQGALLGCV